MRWGRLALMAVLLATRPSAAKANTLLLELCVNGACSGPAFVVVENKTILVDEQSASDAGLRTQTLPKRKAGKRSLVEVTAIGHGSKAVIDMKQGRLNLDLPGQAFGGGSVAINASRTRRDAGADPSAFINYAIDLGTSRGASSVFFDAGIADGHWLLRGDPSWNAAQGFLRGLSRLEYDDTTHDRRWTFGDQFAYSNDGLGGTALIGGIGVARAFDLDPYLITFPQPVISGVLQAPGTINVYENGVLVAQRQVPAGPFNLASLGLGSGQNTVRVVVQDPFGGTSVLQQNFYGANTMLAPGFSDYAYQLGFERVSPQAEGYVLQRPVALARQNLGLTDFLSAGNRIEAEAGLVDGGPNLELRLPLGILTAGAAASRSRTGTGNAFSAAYQYSARLFSVGAGWQDFSKSYRRIGDDDYPASFRPLHIAYANASLSPMPRLDLSISASDSAYADGSRQRDMTASAQYNLPRGIAATLSFERSFDRPGREDSQISFNVTIPLGRASVGFTATRDSVYGNEYGFSAQRSLPTNEGFGFNADAEFGRQGFTGIGQADYQTQLGLIQVEGQRIAGASSGNVLVSSSLVGIDGQAFASRPVREGFALVQVPDSPNAVVTRENQPVGRTDANGNLLVTDLLPYQANRIGIDQSTVPMQDAIAETDKVVGVPRLGGTVIRFGVHRLHAARGILQAHGTPLRYGTATLHTAAGPRRTLIGLDGSIYFDDLPPGHYVLEAHSLQGDMRCPVVMPASKTPLSKLGRIACAGA